MDRAPGEASPAKEKLPSLQHTPQHHCSREKAQTPSLAADVIRDNTFIVDKENNSATAERRRGSEKLRTPSTSSGVCYSSTVFFELKSEGREIRAVEKAGLLEHSCTILRDNCCH
jgi:hypothetical protein